MIKSYVVSMEGPRGILAVIYDAANDVDAFQGAAEIVQGRIQDLDPIAPVEIIRPDATSMDTRPRADWMASFAQPLEAQHARAKIYQCQNRHAGRGP